MASDQSQRRSSSERRTFGVFPKVLQRAKATARFLRGSFMVEPIQLNVIICERIGQSQKCVQRQAILWTSLQPRRSCQKA